MAKETKETEQEIEHGARLKAGWFFSECGEFRAPTVEIDNKAVVGEDK